MISLWPKVSKDNACNTALSAAYGVYQANCGRLSRRKQMQITLSQFEAIDSLLSQQLRAVTFETCADPRGYIATSNRLLDACIDAMGLAFVNDYASAEECAAVVVAHSLLSPSFVGEDA